MFEWYQWTKIMPFLTNICFNMASDWALVVNYRVIAQNYQVIT